jgi:hypothetical protein
LNTYYNKTSGRLNKERAPSKNAEGSLWGRFRCHRGFSPALGKLSISVRKEDIFSGKAAYDSMLQELGRFLQEGSLPWKASQKGAPTCPG